MSYHFADLPTPAAQTRSDGWTPALQRRFVETLAATGIIQLACEAVRISGRSAYNLRIHRDGAAFRLGWDAAVLIARGRLVDELMTRSIAGQTETIRRDEESGESTRHRHDNRLAMSMLARLDRMADSPADGTDAALARVVAQDFAAYLDLLCPADQAGQEAQEAGLPRPGAEPSARDMADARLMDGSFPPEPTPTEEAAAAAISPGASAALFVAARTSIIRGQNAQISAPQERCELKRDIRDIRDTPPGLRHTLPPQQAATLLSGVWWDEERERLRTDFPPPPGFDGDESAEEYDIEHYERDLTAQEQAHYIDRCETALIPYEDAAADARDAYFGFVPEEEDEEAEEEGGKEDGADEITPHPSGIAPINCASAATFAASGHLADPSAPRYAHHPSHA